MRPDSSRSRLGTVPRRRPRSLAALLLAVLVGAEALLGAPRPAFADAGSREEMLELGTPPLILHAAPERARIAADLARGGAAEVDRIARALGVKAPARIDAWLLPRQGDESPESFGLPAGPSWASGLTLHDRPTIILRTDEERGEAGNEVATTLTHELVHAIMLDALRGIPARVPAWWKEGVAAHLASEWRLVQSVHVVGLAMTGSFVPLSDIEDAFPVGGARVQWAYLESFAFVRWLDERSGRDALAVVHRGLLDGKSFRAAFIEAYGESPTRLEEEWKQEFLWRYRWIPLLTSSSTLWGVVMLAFLIVGIVKRRDTTRRLEAWEDEPDEFGGADEPGEPDVAVEPAEPAEPAEPDPEEPRPT